MIDEPIDEPDDPTQDVDEHEDEYPEPDVIGDDDPILNDGHVELRDDHAPGCYLDRDHSGPCDDGEGHAPWCTLDADHRTSDDLPFCADDEGRIGVDAEAAWNDDDGAMPADGPVEGDGMLCDGMTVEPLTHRLARENAASIKRVETRIEQLVGDRLDINREVKELRAALVALNAAGRHFAKQTDGAS